MKIYKHKDVNNLQNFYKEILHDTDSFPTIGDHLSVIAKRMWEGFKSSESIIFKEISNYHPDLLGKSNKELAAMKLSFEDCQKTIANEYGFDNWQKLEESANKKYDPEFEKAVNVLLEGDFKTLKSLLNNRPNLINTRSAYGHGATLLHYTASNGVEMWRQYVPYNLPEMTSYLIQSGADRNAKMKVYGGHFTTLELLSSSDHARKAGIINEMIRILR